MRTIFNKNKFPLRIFYWLVFLTLPILYSELVTAQSSAEDNYGKIKASISRARANFQERFEKCTGDTCKTEIIQEARQYVFNMLTDSIFPAWYGTRWDFNGTTRVPGKGGIACGCFVIFTLQDAGFRIPSKMCQQPSENIIKNLARPGNIKRFSNSTPMDKIEAWIRKKGEGLYIVGLDIHVGFIIYKNDSITFCHSNYYSPPLSVVNQPLTEKSPLTDSQYRVIGKILDDKAIEKWIKGENFTQKYDYFKH